MRLSLACSPASVRAPPNNPNFILAPVSVCHSGTRAQRANPEPMNTGFANDVIGADDSSIAVGVHGFRASFLRNDPGMTTGAPTPGSQQRRRLDVTARQA